MTGERTEFTYEQCRVNARRALDALHEGLTFIEDGTRELRHGWLFRFAIPTGDPDDPWDYLIGCSNEIFVNRYTGQVEGPPGESMLEDWMQTPGTPGS